MPKVSKRYTELAAKVDDRAYAPLEAIELVKANANAKFDETVEAHVRLGIDPKYTDQQLRTTVALPHGTGQSIRIAVIARGEAVAAAKAAGADIAGDDDLVEEIAKTKLPDLNCTSVESAVRIIAGTARNMGVTIND